MTSRRITLVALIVGLLALLGTGIAFSATSSPATEQTTKLEQKEAEGPELKEQDQKTDTDNVQEEKDDTGQHEADDVAEGPDQETD